MTQSAARRISVAGAVHQEVGTVIGGDRDAGFLVQSASGVFTARRAVSCLVEPREHDRVLLAVPPHGDLYVLAVLERDEPGVEIQVDGRLTLQTEDHIQLKGKEGVALETKRFDVRAGAARLAFGAVELIARTAEAKLEVSKIVSDAIDVVSERLLTQAKRSYRFIEELDATRARNVDLRAEETVHVRGKNALTSAEQLYKVDAEQIHLG
jgi:hypothetical protein